MKKIILFIVLLGIISTLSAQRVYYIYFQSEGNQPFVVKVADKFHSSAASGYLILSKLYDSTYNVAVSFPQKEWPVQYFSVPIKSKDHGFLLKNFGEKGWGLFDLQTMSVQMSSSNTANKETSGNTQNVSDFTDLLSKASDDPSLKEKQPAVKQVEEKKTSVTNEQQAPIVLQEKKESTALTPPVLKTEETKTKVSVTEKIAQKPDEADTPVKASDEKLPDTEKNENNKKLVEPAVNQEKLDPYQKSVVSKRSESSTTGGFGLVFTDEYADGTKDTVSIFIPNPNLFSKQATTEKKEEKKFLDIKTEIPVSKEKEEIMERKDTPITNSGKCPGVANESDFFQVRKKMAAAETNEEMMIQAKLYFAQKCFTTEQIKNLSTLFLTDEEKYRFLDIAYTHVLDAENYKSLETELKDEYYITRFKAMLRN